MFLYFNFSRRKKRVFSGGKNRYNWIPIFFLFKQILMGIYLDTTTTIKKIHLQIRRTGYWVYVLLLFILLNFGIKIHRRISLYQ